VKIDEVSLRNFGPYFGEHRVLLSTSDESPVIIIHGENTWGKTSFLNAIRWGLYGRVRGIDRRDKPIWRLVNRDAYPQGERLTSVAISFVHDGVPFRLERQAAFDDVPGPDTHFDDRLTLMENGKFVETKRIHERIGTILHEGISRFFLFDAEMLEEFERLVTDPGSGSGSANVVREQVEQALGLPALALAREDLGHLHDAAARKQFRSIKSSFRGAVVEAEASQTEDELRSIQKNLEALVEQRDSLVQQRDVLSEKRSSYVEIQSALAELDQIESNIGDLRSQEKDQLLHCQRSLAGTWWLALSDTLAGKAEEVRRDVDRAAVASREVEQLSGEKSFVEKSLEGSTCSMCGQEFPDGRVDALRDSLDRISSQLVTLRAQFPDTARSAQDLARLVPLLGGTSLAEYRKMELDLRATRLKLRAGERRKSLIEQRIGAHDREDIRDTERQYDSAIVEIASLNKEIDAERARQEHFAQNLARLRKEAGRLAGASPRIATEASLYEALEHIFETGIDKFRDQMRVDVEREASDIFRSLTTEALFTGLSINDSFGLTIVDAGGRPMPDKSAGAAQIIALSLVAALNRCALREAPVIVDTPLARLDEGHRSKVLQLFPTMGRQVVFMPHSGEFDRQVHLPLLGSQVSREYKIIRENLQSDIVPFDN
jgi:DNA sulfur modification protein DndD